MLARRQAQLTERSLEEQNEHARLTLEFDLFSRIGERLESPHWLNTRRAAAEYLLENAFEGNEVVEVTALNTAVWEVCNLFEEIGELLRLGVLRAETVANRSGARSEAYWTLCKPAIERYRGEWKMDALYEGFEYLRQRVVEVNRERDVSVLTQESIRGLLEDELGLVEEEPPPPQSEGG